ncbi:MAG TPA: adenine deaminase [Dehalococcoidia bacterium]|jgi:adenine deaminase
MSLADLIAVARGDAPADLLIKNAKIINTFVGIIEEGNVAIFGDRIAGIGSCYVKAKETIDIKGNYLAPGFIDGHTHIESSMLHPAHYAHAVVPRGTTTVVTDLHEITNVAGFHGIIFVIDWAKKLPLDMFFMAPSCVPATHMETSGAEMRSEEIAKALTLHNVIGLGEMMNFPGVINGDREVLKKITAAQDKVIDGHAPRVTNKHLNAYIAAGIYSDHESTSTEEGREKLRRGMHLMIREGSSAKNLDALLPLVNDKTYKRCFFVVDDRSCSDLLREGDIDDIVRKAIQKGLEPIRAIQMATINAAEYFRLYDRGGIAPGYVANLITFADLPSLNIDMVFYRGRLVAKRGKYQGPVFKTAEPDLTDTVRIKPFDIEALKLTTRNTSLPIIEIVPDQILTKKRIESVKTKDGTVMCDLDEDILKLVVVERHKASGRIGLCMAKGFGLKRGALASSIAHDSHNIVAVGTNDVDIFAAIKGIEKLKGGLVVCIDGKLAAALPLPIAGLLSPEPLEAVVKKFEKVEKMASRLGNLPPAVFSLLSFIALPVIPDLRLTDRGLVDVLQFKLIK